MVCLFYSLQERLLYDINKIYKRGRTINNNHIAAIEYQINKYEKYKNVFLTEYGNEHLLEINIIENNELNHLDCSDIKYIYDNILSKSSTQNLLDTLDVYYSSNINTIHSKAILNMAAFVKCDSFVGNIMQINDPCYGNDCLFTTNVTAHTP